jgi:hypothetical protein
MSLCGKTGIQEVMTGAFFTACGRKKPGYPL